jgi:glycosyltransferase involved in cell wall biosynthesis
MILNIFARYSSTHASTRVRFLQFFPALKEAGFDVRLFTIIQDRAVRGAGSIASIVILRVGSWLKVAHHVFRLAPDSLLHIHIELFPWLPYFIERQILRVAGIQSYSLELDDAWFHVYDRHHLRVVRFFLGTKIDKLMKGSTVVFAGNQYIADRATAAGARQVVIVPTVVDTQRYAPSMTNQQSKISTSRRMPVIGWIGSPATTPFLTRLRSVILELHNSGIATFVAIGADASQLGDVPITVLPWSELEEVRMLYAFDIGIMPLNDSPFERGKCGYKLIQYMACALPIVASPVGVNSVIVQHDVNGFLAADVQEWKKYLEILCRDNELRRKMGVAGLKRAIHQYSLAAVAPQVISIFNRANGSRGS